MRIAVAGATGNIGARTVSILEGEGHEVVGISRGLGVDLITGEGQAFVRTSASSAWCTSVPTGRAGTRVART